MGAAAAVLLSVTAVLAAKPRPLWLAVGKAGLVDALSPLLEHRKADGFEVLVSTSGVAEALKAAPRRPAHLLLVGDDEPGKEARPWYLPAKRRPVYRWMRGQTLELVSDTLWGSLDGDLIPDVPVGRIPARKPEQVALVVRKVIAFERQAMTLEDLFLPVWAGAPCYGTFFDGLASSLLVGNVTGYGPPWADPWLISANAHHPLCGWPPEQATLFTRRMKAGGLMGVFLCHAFSQKAFSMTFRDRAVYYSAEAARGLMGRGEPAPPLVLLACLCGNFTGAKPCLTESLVLLPGGPVAAIGATVESHPLPNYFSGVGLMQAQAAGHERLGSMWLAAQRWALAARNPVIELALGSLEGKLTERIDIGKLKRDQILMYCLLGDPATRLKLPKRLDVTVTRRPDGWAWRALKPAGATALHVGLRGAVPTYPPVEGELTRAEALARFERANAALRFSQTARLTGAQKWEGTIRQSGSVRFAATGSDGVHVAVVKLAPPATEPPTGAAGRGRSATATPAKGENGQD